MAHAQVIVRYREYELPWTTSAEQEQRFKRVAKAVLAGVLALALLLSVLPVPERDPADANEIPQRFARLVLERPEPPPPPPVVREQPEPEPEPIVEERVVEVEPEPAPEPEPQPVTPPPTEPPPVDRTQQARERARGAGLLPFAQELASLRDNTALDQLDGAQRAAASVNPDASRPERAVITARSGSGGIDTTALSRDTGGAGLAERATTQVASPVESVAAAAPEPVRTGSGELPSRSREEIERVFDRNKGAIYALYNRALRENPALEGKLVLRLTIAPDGRVTACEVVSSELNDPVLEERLVQRVLLFQFEPKDVAPITTTKPIDFFPA